MKTLTMATTLVRLDDPALSHPLVPEITTRYPLTTCTTLSADGETEGAQVIVRVTCSDDVYATIIADGHE